MFKKGMITTQLIGIPLGNFGFLPGEPLNQHCPESRLDHYCQESRSRPNCHCSGSLAYQRFKDSLRNGANVYEARLTEYAALKDKDHG
ncbi:hypothetical protein CEXT_395061 [Caerostris extrusa]|uniref:Uncharacterized protein n=1 Tax=Caerostris extrusa TaxID=172846 RepID=A0AAV4YEG6_CAEEX|nr:hypothetical protein CEXT_395061 [Caerostris extrusa]